MRTRALLNYPLLTHLRFTSTNARTRLNRRGHNLTERFRTLENSIHGQNTPSLSQDSTSIAQEQRAHHEPAGNVRERTIGGFVVPEEPVPPADDECCMSGCAVCVYDLYEESLSAYKASVQSLRSALTASSIPEDEWPAHIRTTHMSSTGSGAVLSAFEEMERALEEKRARRSAGEAEKMARGDMVEGDGEHARIGQLVEGIRWMLFPHR